METRSRRRMQAKETMGLADRNLEVELQKVEVKELERQNKKIRKRNELMQSSSYRLVAGIATVMDKYFLDPILGLFSGVGDVLSGIFVLPTIYVALFKVKSIPLTLAVILNILIDMMLGSIPFWIGDIIDCFHRAYIKNLRLIDGFVNDDKEVIEEVNKKAVISAILIVIVCLCIYGIIALVSSIFSSVSSWFS